MYGHTKYAAVLPATGLGAWNTALGVIAVLLIIAGLVITARNAKMSHRP